MRNASLSPELLFGQSTNPYAYHSVLHWPYWTISEAHRAIVHVDKETYH